MRHNTLSHSSNRIKNTCPHAQYQIKNKGKNFSIIIGIESSFLPNRMEKSNPPKILEKERTQDLRRAARDLQVISLNPLSLLPRFSGGKFCSSDGMPSFFREPFVTF